MKYSQFPSRMCAMAFIEQIRSLYPNASVILEDGGRIVAWSK